MFASITRFSVRLVDRYLPDPYIFVVILTLIAAAAAILVEGKSPAQVSLMWGDGFWKLLQFSMQMVLVLVTGYILAMTPLVRKGLVKVAKLANSPASAIVLTTLVALFASWINWGFGLVVGGIFAKELARTVRVDYRLLVASAYSGFLVWHGGLSSSIALTIATPNHFMEKAIGVISTADTIFAPFNLMIVGLLFIFIPLVNRLMLPSDKDSIYINPELLEEKPHAIIDNDTPAGKLEKSKILTALIGLAGLSFIFQYFIIKNAGLNLNIINFIFLFSAIILHGSPRNLLNSLQEAISGSGGIILQFPFYAGIMAIVTDSGLAATLSKWLVSYASADSLPFLTFISAGIVNVFVPSGGGQWAVQAPVIIEAAKALNVDIARMSMAVAWGDAWTNMLQPFWALPILAIAGLRAKDIMGFCLILLFVSGVIISIGLTWF